LHEYRARGPQTNAGFPPRTSSAGSDRPQAGQDFEANAAASIGGAAAAGAADSEVVDDHMDMGDDDEDQEQDAAAAYMSEPDDEDRLNDALAGAITAGRQYAGAAASGGRYHNSPQPGYAYDDEYELDHMQGVGADPSGRESKGSRAQRSRHYDHMPANGSSRDHDHGHGRHQDQQHRRRPTA